MNRDEVICMAREAGFATSWTVAAGEALERFAELVAKAEREECAKVCDERAAAHPIGTDEQCEAEDCAAAIRARGEV